MAHRSSDSRAPCCGKFYVCRLCHDAAENHQMDRFQVKEVKCAVCDSVQQAQQVCKACGVSFGEYYCDICHLFDKNKKQYHCQPCGICRIGPREKYFHCLKCNLCLASDLQGKHKVGNVSMSQPLTQTPEGLMVVGTVWRMCPGRIVLSVWRTSTHPGLEPMSCRAVTCCTRLATRACAETGRCGFEWCGLILCNDCQNHCTVPFHVLGMKCSKCGSYNTAQASGLIKATEQPPESEAQ
ncbi:hypothetical protein NFI96_023495 [Prochilodus magdalenae]|nr:hypothetical protein NFI96_023495 [Prochilodus magdalenae]